MGVFAVGGQAKQTGKNLYPLLQDLYAALRYIHHEMATHIYVDIGIEPDDEGEPNSEMLDILNEAILKVGRFSDRRVQSKFLSGLIAQTKAYIQFLIDNKYSELEMPYELGEVETEDGDEVPNYLKKTIEFGISDEEPVKVIRGVEVPNVVIKEIRTEMEETDESVLDSLEGFNVCGSDDDGFETGGACMWVIDQVKYDALPDDQRDGFHNTQINADVNALFNDRGFLTREYFTGVAADDRLRLFNNSRKNRINDENGFYVHTHMAYDNDAFLRVYTYQHVAERNYPGQVQKVCFCDWRKLTQVAEQTDCTLTTRITTDASSKMARMTTIRQPSPMSLAGSLIRTRAIALNKMASICAAGTARTPMETIRSARTTTKTRSRKQTRVVTTMTTMMRATTTMSKETRSRNEIASLITLEYLDRHTYILPAFLLRLSHFQLPMTGKVKNFIMIS